MAPHLRIPTLAAALFACLMVFVRPAEACVAFSPLGRVTSTLTLLPEIRDPSLLIIMANQLEAEVNRLDPELLASLLSLEFPNAEPGWTERALQQMRRMAGAAAANQTGLVSEIAENPQFRMAQHRFERASGMTDCPQAADEPYEVFGRLNAMIQGANQPDEELPDAAEPDNQTSPENAPEQLPSLLENPYAIASIVAIFVALAGAVGLYGIFRAPVSKRREARVSCSYETTLVVDNGRTSLSLMGASDDAEATDAQPSRILNVHSSGVCMTQPDQPVEKGAISFQIGPDWVSGKVRWANQVCFGASVDTPLSRDQIDEVLMGTEKDSARVDATGRQGLRPAT